MQPSPSVKNEMAPPTRAGAENEHADHKGHDTYASQQDAEGEHEGEYTHQSASYGARKSSYSGNPNPPPGTIHSDSSHISPEMTHSPHQNGGSGRATPRTAAPYSGYNTPQRASQLPSSNLYNVMSNDARAGTANGQESYPAQGYAGQQYASMNGVPQSNKRNRDTDGDEDQYGNGLKRARTEVGPVSARPIAQPHSIKPIR
jgi:protein SOK2